jgi:hypothetical protein
VIAPQLAKLISAIINQLFDGMPDEFTPNEIKFCAESVLHHVENTEQLH